MHHEPLKKSMQTVDKNCEHSSSTADMPQQLLIPKLWLPSDKTCVYLVVFAVRHGTAQHPWFGFIVIYLYDFLVVCTNSSGEGS